MRSLFNCLRACFVFSTYLSFPHIKKKKGHWNILPEKPLLICALDKNKMGHRRLPAVGLVCPLFRGAGEGSESGHPRTCTKTGMSEATAGLCSCAS